MEDTKQTLLQFIKAHQGKVLGLGELYPFFRLLTGALYAEKRWVKRVEMCRVLGLEEGEELTESVLEHTGIDIPLLGAVMLGLEESNGTADGLDPALLHLAFTIHDTAESLKGDVCFSQKTEKDEQEEADYFQLIISVLPPEARAYLQRAYDIAEERSEAVSRLRAPLSSISKNARFFWAVELVGYLMKALFEAQKGKKAFVDVLREQAPDILTLQEFHSFKVLVNPFLGEIGQEIANHPFYGLKK